MCVTTLVFLGNTEQPYGYLRNRKRQRLNQGTITMTESCASLCITPVIFLKPQNLISKMPLYKTYKIQQVIYLKYDHLHHSKHKQTAKQI